MNRRVVLDQRPPISTLGEVMKVSYPSDFKNMSKGSIPHVTIMNWNMIAAALSLDPDDQWLEISEAQKKIGQTIKTRDDPTPVTCVNAKYINHNLVIAVESELISEEIDIAFAGLRRMRGKLEAYDTTPHITIGHAITQNRNRQRAMLDTAAEACGLLLPDLRVHLGKINFKAPRE